MSRRASVLSTPIAPIPESLLPTVVRINQVSNKNGPDHKFQINRHLLYEREFPGQVYISAHLQRLQNGVYTDTNLHDKNALYVTFAAITFTIHPSHSVAHRCMSAIITIKAESGTGGNLKFLKFAPHLAYGRLSTESLKWNFQLGATVGITKGPVNLCVNPTQGYEKEKVVGTMLKIQGSTRSTQQKRLQHLATAKRWPDTKLVWSLEENSQQETGLPREFTFIFLIERKNPRDKLQEKLSNLGSLLETPKEEDESSSIYTQETSIDKDGKSQTCDQSSFSKARELFLDFRKKNVYTYSSSDPEHSTLSSYDESYVRIFSPIHLSIKVEPLISGIRNVSAHSDDADESVIAGEVGQRFPTEGTDDSAGKIEHPEAMVSELYNFAKLPGNFEDFRAENEDVEDGYLSLQEKLWESRLDLHAFANEHRIELPGNAVTTVEPVLPEAGMADH